ncbi:MAG TPA: metallophosphoesterase family protein [Ktedonobacteraceae bacterium]|nr:metallophosphoesterase family protein [Ktedonobacteraceae bacterium]
MRVAILSDVHGNQLALDAVLEDIAHQPAIDQIVVAGDICLNGPCPREALETVQKLYCPVLQGNVDFEVVTQAPEKGSKKRSVVAWTREQIGQVGIDYLASLPFSHTIHSPECGDLLIVHANPLNLEEHIPPDLSDTDLEQLLGGLDPTVSALAFGHLHIAYTRTWRHLLLVDVGSCGMPRDKDPRASYAVLSTGDTSWQAEIHRVEYDVKAVVKQIRSCGMPNAEKRIKVLTEASY